MLAASLVLPARGIAADWTVVPSVRTRATYSDNFNLLPQGSERSELVAEVSPGIAVSAKSARLNLSAAYAVQAIGYSHESSNLTHSLLASASATLVDNWLYGDAHASISRQNNSAFGPQIVDPANRTGNESEVRTLSVAPALRHRFRGLATVQANLAVEELSAGPLHSRSNNAGVVITSDGDLRGWGWEVDASRNRLDDDAVAPVTMKSASGSVFYTVTPRLVLSAAGGYESNDYVAIAGPAQGHFWNVGVRWAPTPRTSISVNGGRRYFGNTYGFDLSHRARHSVWRMYYSEDITTTHAQYLALNRNDTSAALNQLFRSSLPEPLLRQQVVDLFLQKLNSLGPQLGRVNYFSHGIYLQKTLAASLALATPRSTLLFNAFGDTRTAQTSNILDSILLPPTERTLNDKTRQRGADATWIWQPTSRTSLNLSAARTLAVSLSNGRRDNNLVMRAGFTRQLQRKLSGSVELRRTSHSSTSGGAYREHAISAALEFLL